MSGKSKSNPAESPSPIGEISQEPSAFESFLDANQKKLVIVGFLIILILVGYIVYDGLKDMEVRGDSAMVSSAKTVPELEKVITELGEKTAGGSALMKKALVLWVEQQRQEAVATVEEFVSKYPEHPAIGSAYARLGSFQQQLGNLTEAKSAFQSAVDAKSAASSYALISLGDLARDEGKDEEAKAFYQRVITEYEETHFGAKSLANERLELVGVKQPTEKKPEPPKPEAKTPPVTIPPKNPATPDSNKTPGNKPAEKPAPTPGDKSADKPASTPGDKPADNTAPETDKPETTEPAQETTETDKPDPAVPNTPTTEDPKPEPSGGASTEE